MTDNQCPFCGEIGSIATDPVSSSRVCRKCRTAVSNVGSTQMKEEPKKEQPKKKQVATTKTIKKDLQPYPMIPKDALALDIIEEFADDERTLKVAVIYCPGVKTKDESLFDPNTNFAKFAETVYKEKFKNRRRYIKRTNAVGKT